MPSEYERGVRDAADWLRQNSGTQWGRLFADVADDMQHDLVDKKNRKK